MFDDTIAAIATPPGGALRGMIRLSGPDAVEVLCRCFHAGSRGPLADVRQSTVVPGQLSLSPSLGALPCDLYLWPASRSYTRQPTGELHTIGSPPLLEAALQSVCAAGARLAEPGEFTMRAFLAGRIDLTQAEAVLGVIDAADRRQLEIALTQLAGGLAGPLARLRNDLLDVLAHLEAGLDFVEEDIELIAADQIDRQLHDAATALAGIAEQMAARGESSGEIRIVLIGRPNVGKSSLLNALAGDTGAIVSHRPGTTRDYLVRQVDFGGLPCLLVDTAGIGINKTADPVHTAARDMTKEQRRQAHLQLLCLDSTQPPNQWEREQVSASGPVEQIVVLTKIDAMQQETGRSLFPEGLIRTSSKTGAGLDRLRREIHRRVESLLHAESNVVAGTAARCRESLRLAAESLDRARQIAAARTGEEFVAFELRSALNELGKVVGAVYTDDILDRVFSRFCIGK